MVKSVSKAHPRLSQSGTWALQHHIVAQPCVQKLLCMDRGFRTARRSPVQAHRDPDPQPSPNLSNMASSGHAINVLARLALGSMRLETVVDFTA